MDLKEVKYKSNFEVATRHPWELARFEVACDIIEDRIHKNDLKVIFDIGCGDTFFLESLSLRYPGLKYYGVDIAFSDMEILEKSNILNNKGIFLFNDLDVALEHCGQEISLILLMDVIEHIKDDSGFLKMLKSKNFISGKTTFLITVPAFQGLFCQHDVFLEHFRRYTNATLRKLLSDCGYSCDRIGYFFTSLLFPRILQVVKEKIFSPNKYGTTGLSEWEGSKSKSVFFRHILVIDYKLAKLFGNKLPGLSNFVVCRKSV